MDEQPEPVDTEAIKRRMFEWAKFPGVGRYKGMGAKLADKLILKDITALVLEVERLREQTAGYELGDTSTVYMDGSEEFRLRRRGVPGILASVRMRRDDVERMNEALRGSVVGDD